MNNQKSNKKRFAGLPAGYNIRQARSDDLRHLQEIEEVAVHKFADYGLDALLSLPVTSLEALNTALENEMLWVAEFREKSVVGFALAVRIGDGLHLQEVDVLPQHGGRGVGSSLVTRVIEWARQQGFPAVTLTTYRDIPWNGPFYERFGFRELTPDELSPELQQILTDEAASGLPSEDRVAMRMQLD